MTNTQNAQPAGDIRVTGCLGRKGKETFTIRSKFRLEGAGITKIMWNKSLGGTYRVSTHALEKLERNYNVVCDF